MARSSTNLLTLLLFHRLQQRWLALATHEQIRVHALVDTLDFNVVSVLEVVPVDQQVSGVL